MKFNPVRKPVRIAGFGLITATLLPLYVTRDAMVGGGPRKRAELRDRWTGRWARSLLRLFSVHPNIVGAIPPRAGGCLVVANHRSTIDIALMLSTFGGCVVSRADLSQWPIIGTAAKKVGTLFVERSSKQSGAQVIRRMAARLASGDVVSLFPEGTTFPDDEVRPFSRGGFVAAVRAGVPVLPVGIAYEQGSGAAFVDESFMEHLDRMSKAPPTKVTVCIGDLLPTDDGRAATLATRAHEAVSDLVKKARSLS
ncbi:lysophospholipid acyltransferase family protein [Pendulispora albinea]|uniref:1-acyl-sn-glycerol-3-phosphate acyltransferase n=1 Tax=Pendulispora albinea TaxID=2741071 RepID=A0ABZ2LJL4_9BACT